MAEKQAGQVSPEPGTKPAAEAAGAQKVAETPPAGTKAADGTPAEGSAATGTTAGDGTAAAPKPPEKYALTIPDGAKAFVDAKDLEEVAAIAKEYAWTNEEAQAYLELQAGAIGTKLTAFRADTEADPTYGGEKLEESQQFVKRVLDRVRPEGHPRAESFRRLLNKTGIGNHLEMFSFLADIGKLMREDQPPGSISTPRDTKRSHEDVLYDGGKKAS